MIIFQHFDKKFLSLKYELNKIGIESDAVKGHPIFAPFFILKQLIKRKKIKVYVFRYINDSDSFLLALLRYISEFLKIFICKIFNIKIWWLCHNVDKETKVFYPKITNLRRKNISKYASRIFTTNKFLIPIAQKTFPNKFVDSLSLGYLEGSIYNNNFENKEINKEIIQWIKDKKAHKCKIVFCIGSPADKSFHFKLISRFINAINEQDKMYKWYAIVIGDKIEKNSFIYNYPNKHFINMDIITEYADYYYRVINDYSISYSIFEAVRHKIPIITEPYGILSEIIEHYKIGIVVESYDDLISQINNFQLYSNNFQKFESENNWEVASNKIKYYYQIDTK